MQDPLEERHRSEGLQIQPNPTGGLPRKSENLGINVFDTDTHAHHAYHQASGSSRGHT